MLLLLEVRVDAEVVHHQVCSVMTGQNVVSQVVNIGLSFSVGGMTIKYKGCCQCGGITYEAVGDPVIVEQCPCEQCRGLSGTGHTMGAMFALSSVTMCGQLGKYCYTSDFGSKVTKSFYRDCGSPICGANSLILYQMTITWLQE
jgi:hypothetical protein